MALSRGLVISPEPYFANSYLLSWKRPIYDPVRCFGSKSEFDFGNRSHKTKIQAESIGCPFNLLKNRANLNVSQ